MDLLRALHHSDRGSAAAEIALITPLLLILMLGSMELGNYFLNAHALSKEVRDGARYASRLTIDGDYVCPTSVFEDTTATTKIQNVTKTGTVDGTGTGRFSTTQWGTACPSATALVVSLRCVPEGTYTGIYSGLDGDIPVVKVSAAIRYSSVLSAIGFNAGNYCLRAESEAPVVGL